MTRTTKKYQTWKKWEELYRCTFTHQAGFVYVTNEDNNGTPIEWDFYRQNEVPREYIYRIPCTVYGNVYLEPLGYCWCPLTKQYSSEDTGELFSSVEECIDNLFEEGDLTNLLDAFKYNTAVVWKCK